MNKTILNGLKTVIAAAALMSFAPLAFAQAPGSRVKDITISQGFQKKLEKDYGVREADGLKQDLQRAIDKSLSKAGQTKVAYVSVTIKDARPNKPTFEQLNKNLSLSYADSLGAGGATIEATLYDASGGTLGTVKHSYFTSSLQDVTTLSTWGDADRAFSGAASKIRKEAERNT